MPGSELIGEEEKNAIVAIFENGGELYRYGVENSLVNEFEKKIADRVGAKYALCVSTGTAAVKLALIGLGVKSGDEVITQSFTFIATVEAILELGAIPVITEVDKSLNMDPTDLEKKITAKTKVIMPVPMAGVAPDMDRIVAIAQEHNIPIVEDSAQALGATYHGKHLGTIGKAGIYSLDFGKVITTGEGGLLVTDDEDIYLKAREYSDHGHEQNPNVPRGEDTRSTWGFNYKVSELCGAMGLEQLKKLDYILEQQRNHKKKIKDAIKDLPEIEFREIPDPEGDACEVLIFYMKTQESALLVSKKLKEQGIGNKNLPDAIDWHFAGTWTQIFNNYEKYKGKNLEEVWSQSSGYLRRAIALPIMVNMTDQRIEEIIAAIKTIVQEV